MVLVDMVGVRHKGDQEPVKPAFLLEKKINCGEKH